LTGGFGAVIEHMSQMGITPAAQDLNSAIEATAVDLFVNAIL
jgi:hypothetical protein